jgi:hypothetical protein
MRIVALSLLFLWTSHPCRLPEQSRKVKKLQDQYNAEYPAYAKAAWIQDSAGAARMLTGEKLTKEQMAALEAKKKHETHGASQRLTVLHSSRERFSPHSSKPYRCKASRNQRRRRDRQ